MIQRFLKETSEFKTIQDYIRWSASQFNNEQVFFGHGTSNALDEAASLVLHALHLDYSLPDSYLHCAITESERQSVVELISRRITERKPAAYLTNQAVFCNLSFYVDERTLIPRSPIAELIHNAFSPWLDIMQVESILDLCTGSGCIAIAAAYQFDAASIDAVDLSADALEVARINVSTHELEEQVQLIHSDLFTELGNKQYDLIISNPPYVSTREWQSLPQEYSHEPAFGFQGGESGLDIVTRILNQAGDYLTEQGILVVEVGRSAETLQNNYPDIPFLWLDFEFGGDGVFLLTREQLVDYQHRFNTQSDIDKIQ
ncbi:MAG: 50S ribosomal protein L3 N(5)-glutamine methyltransferase [Gammaproteobacteria bacterium]|nr:50S ribosomal protein L3 N(5)-glutamine methyltransferase [Gammaproteobacteria bacterium]